jgi:hypothetical protein
VVLTSYSHLEPVVAGSKSHGNVYASPTIEGCLVVGCALYAFFIVAIQRKSIRLPALSTGNLASALRKGTPIGGSRPKRRMWGQLTGTKLKRRFDSLPRPT